MNMMSRSKLLMASLLRIAVLATGAGQQALGGDVTLLETTTDWTTASAWSNNEAPSAGNDYFVNSGFAVQPPVGSGFVTFGGGSLTIGDELTTGKITVNDASRNVTVKINNLTLANGMWTSYNAKTHTLISDQAIQVAGPFTFEHRANTADPLGTKINAVLAGSGDITVSGRSGATGSKNFIEFLQANTVSGSLRMINYVDFNVKNTLAVQNLTLNMQDGDTGRLNFSQDSTVGGLTGARNVNLGAHVISVGKKNEDNIYSGVISNGSLTKIGTGTLTLGGTNTYEGATNVDDGTLVINGSISTSILTTVASGATIRGIGTTGDLTVLSGGFINPGSSPGTLNTGDYAQAGLYAAEIDGLTPGSQHDRIHVTGTVDISGGSLDTIFTGSYSLNDIVFILTNDLADTITGIYSGLAQGAVVENYGGFDWQISYVADSGSSTFTGGNDIALMAVTPIPEPRAALLGGLGLLVLLRRRRNA